MGFQSPLTRNVLLPSLTASAWRSALGILTTGSTTGSIFYVDSVAGSASGGGTSPTTAVTTVALAQALATASKGDIIAFMPGHAETIVAATEFAPAKAGVTYVSLGDGADRATFTFSTNTTANIPVTAASCSFYGIVLVCNVDQVVAAMTISAADVRLQNVEVRDAADNKEFVTPILTTSACDRLTIDGFFHNGRLAGTHCTESLSLIGVDVATITNSRFFGKYSTGCVNMLTTACTRVVVSGCKFQNGTDKTLAKLVVDTQGSSTWCLTESFDLVADKKVYGSSGGPVTPDDGGWRLIAKGSTSPLTAATLFTFTGTIEACFVGRVTTAIQAQATTVKLQVTCDALAAADLCTTKDVNGFAVGSLLTVPGAVASAMIGTTAVGVAISTITPAVMTCVTSGTIQPVFGAASTGAIQWEMAWRPRSRGASAV